MTRLRQGSGGQADRQGSGGQAGRPLVRRSFSAGGWLLIGAVALALRLIGLRYGLPSVYNPDEVAIMSRALAFAKGDLNPHNFLYPSFYFYALFAWEGLTALLAVATREVASVGAFQREFFLDPTRVFVAGRLLTALLGAATAVVTGLLGSRVTSRLVGPLAALLLAVAPSHVAEFALREARRAGHVSHRARVSRVRPALATRRPSLAARGGGDHGGG